MSGQVGYLIMIPLNDIGKHLFQLATRNVQPELMDDPALSMLEHQRALRGLQRIHWLTGTTRKFWNPMERMLQERQQETLSVMDVGCGNANLLQSLWKMAKARGYALELIGCDFSRSALELAQRAAVSQGIPLELHCTDVLKQPLPRQADIVICSLFLHHFANQQVKSILQQMAAAARHRLLVEDLLRSQLGYLLCLFGVQILTRSHVVHVDGPLSVRAAFRVPEITGILEEAGIKNAVVRRCWPERVLIEWNPGEQHA